MKRFLLLSLIAAITISCNDNYIIGGEKHESNKVDMTTYEFLQSMDETKETAELIKRANMVDEVNQNVTLIAPSNYAIDRYLRRKNNRRMRLNPDTTKMTLEDIPADTLQKLKMYIVDNEYWRENIPKEGIKMATHSEGDSLMLSLQESTDEPAAAWDGSGVPGWGYQYPNFMQTTPKKVFVHFKRGDNWEMNGQERISMGLDNPETDKVYQMYLADVQTTTGIVHIIYVGNYNYTSHYYYHTLFFFGTREDDQL